MPLKRAMEPNQPSLTKICTETYGTTVRFPHSRPLSIEGIAVEKKVEPLPDIIPVKERIARYREYAQDALTMAMISADPMRRANLLSSASAWHTLALRTQRMADHAEQIMPGFEAAPEIAPDASPKN